MKSLPHDMTVTPFGWPERDKSFLMYAAILVTRTDYCKAFERDTGSDVRGFEDWPEEKKHAMLGKWLDWIATHHWNVDPSKH